MAKLVRTSSCILLAEYALCGRASFFPSSSRVPIASTTCNAPCRTIICSKSRTSLPMRCPDTPHQENAFDQPTKVAILARA